MKSKINPARRNFFAKIGLGALSAGVMSIVPLKIFGAQKMKKSNSGQQISITIDPMAVKRTNKG